jgi:hypothetical protein
MAVKPVMWPLILLQVGSAASIGLKKGAISWQQYLKMALGAVFGTLT